MIITSNIFYKIKKGLISQQIFGSERVTSVVQWEREPWRLVQKFSEFKCINSVILEAFSCKMYYHFKKSIKFVLGMQP